MLFQKQTLRSPTTEARSPTGAHQLGRKLRESDVSIANHSLFRKTCKNVLLSHVTPSSLVRLFSASRPNREITMRNRHVMPSPQRLPDEMPWTNWLLFVLFVSVRCCHRLQHPFISFIVTAPHTVIDIISVYVISFNVSQFIGGSCARAGGGVCECVRIVNKWMRTTARQSQHASFRCSANCNSLIPFGDTDTIAIVAIAISIRSECLVEVLSPH